MSAFDRCRRCLRPLPTNKEVVEIYGPDKGMEIHHIKKCGMCGTDNYILVEKRD